MEIPDRKAATQEIRISYALDGYCAPRSQCVGRPAPASARGQRPHPLDVQRQAHEVPLAAHLRQASQAESSESEHLLDPPVRRLREPLALRVLGLAREARQLLTHAVRGREPRRVDRHPGLAFTPQRDMRVDAAVFQLQQIRLVAVPRIGQCCSARGLRADRRNRGKRPGGQAAARWRMRSGRGRMGGAPGMSSRLPR